MVDGRGKINGSVASKNRAGAYVRTKVTPVNPNKPNQQLARNLLSTLSQSWRTLTQAQRDAWNAAVTGFAVTDIFGDLRNPTGKNLYTRLNANLFNIGQGFISDPPLPSEVPGVSANVVTIAVGAGTYTVTFDPPGASVRVQVWATPGVSPGKNFVKSEYRLLEDFAGNAVSPHDFSAAYIDRFGAPAVGTKVFIKLRPVNLTTGQAGVGGEASTIVLA